MFKTDFAEGVPVDAVAANGMTGAELHNVYSLLFNDVVADGHPGGRRPRHGLGPLVVPGRAAPLGPVGRRHQLHATRRWAARCAAACRTACPACRSGATTPAASPARPRPTCTCAGPSSARCRRWCASTAPPAGCRGTSPSSPSGRAVDALRLRYRLMPYLYSAAVESARTGVPLMRALLVDSPDDPAAWQADLEYRLGPDLLVAPMTDPTGTRTVYLPRGRLGRLVDRRRSTPAGQHHRVTPAAGPDPAVRPARRGHPGRGAGRLRRRRTVRRDHAAVLRRRPTARTVIRDVDGDTVVTAGTDDDGVALRVAGPARIVAARAAFAAPGVPPVTLHL